MATATSKKMKTQEVRNIATSMINKTEVFKMLALAETTGLPCLLVGPPGVGKTKTVLEYAKAWLNKDGKMTAKDFAEKIYILETDEGTKPSEVKGVPNLSVLFTENRFELSTPIADAEIVIINEVDKASPGIRNALLGVMNEKFLFNGKHKIPCKWKLLIATCNEIPKDEENNPFWDRFMLKMSVSRVSLSEMMKYYEKGARDYRDTVKINIPTTDEMEALKISSMKLSKYLEVAHKDSSDRTLTFVPKITKAVSYIWNCSVDKALVKTAQIMVSQNAGSMLQDKLVTAEMKKLMSAIELIKSYKTKEDIDNALKTIDAEIQTYTQSGKLDIEMVAELHSMIEKSLENHQIEQIEDGNQEFQNAMMKASS
jgi:MoxR-like ATPase